MNRIGIFEMFLGKYGGLFGIWQKYLMSFGGYLEFDKIDILLSQICYAIGQIFIVTKWPNIEK